MFLVIVLILVLAPIQLEVNALSPDDFQNPYITEYELEVPDFDTIMPTNPILLTPSMGLDFTIKAIDPALIDGLYTNDLFYVTAKMISAPEDLDSPYDGIESDGIIEFTYRYNKNIVEVDQILVNNSFSMIGDETYEIIDEDNGIVEASFKVRMDQAHYSNDIVDKIIAQVKFKVIEKGFGDSTVIASAWTEDAYKVEKIGEQNLGGGLVIPIYGNVYEDRANYETLAYSVESLTVRTQDDEGILLFPEFQAPYPEDDTVDAPVITGYDLTSASPLNVFSIYGQRRLLAVFKYVETPEEPEEPKEPEEPEEPDTIVFEDVSESDWFYDDVYAAVDMGLINGKYANPPMYVPEGRLTIAEAIKLAAVMHEYSETGMVTLTNGNPWYQSYVEYCGDFGIIGYDEYDGKYNDQATRSQYAVIFANSLDPSEYGQINQIEDGDIPDVSLSDEYGQAVYKLYRAGILQGNDQEGTFAPTTDIKRSEVAAILTRMMDSSERKTFTLD